MAALPASHGMAVVGLNAMGHGDGPRTTMTVTRTDGTSMAVAAPGSGTTMTAMGGSAHLNPAVRRRPTPFWAPPAPAVSGPRGSYLTRNVSVVVSQPLP